MFYRFWRLRGLFSINKFKFQPTRVYRFLKWRSINNFWSLNGDVNCVLNIIGRWCFNQIKLIILRRGLILIFFNAFYYFFCHTFILFFLNDIFNFLINNHFLFINYLILDFLLFVIILRLHFLIFYTIRILIIFQLLLKKELFIIVIIIVFSHLPRIPVLISSSLLFRFFFLLNIFSFDFLVLILRIYYILKAL